MRESGRDFSREQAKLIESQPRLRYISRSLELLRPEGGPIGEERNWKELYREVRPWNNVLELSDNVREVVRDYVAGKIPKLKERVPSIAELDDEALLDALTHNWFEAVEPGEEGELGISKSERRYVLLTVMAHVVKRVENAAYRKVFETAQPADFKKLGLDEDYRELLIDSMEISAKADPLHARFLAYSQVIGEPPSKAQETSMFLLGDRKPHTLRELFPLKRLGRKPGTIIDEAKAEALFPALVPKMIAKGALPGTGEQWGVGILGSKLQMLRDQPEGDEYYHAAAYALNRLFKDQAIVMDGEQVKILDFNKFYQSQGQAAREILALYQDSAMTENRAKRWVAENCAASRQVKRLKKVLEAQT